MADEVLLRVHDLRVHFKTDEGVVRAVDGVSFELKAGATLGIVGESGSGKSVTCNAVMRLIPRPPGVIAGGSIVFDGVDILTRSEAEMRALRGNRMSMIFQDPMTSLNPFLSVSRQLTEVLELHEGLGAAQARARAIEMLEMVGIPDPQARIDHYPHQLSGGMRQRVMIAMALLCRPQLLIADEPTTALDVTIQAQILSLIRDLRRKVGTAVILITHDLGVVAGMADEIMVMYAGRVVEEAPVDDLFRSPGHPYTHGLLRSIPRLDRPDGALASIRGLPPMLSRVPPGCPFHPRCDRASEVCRARYPEAVEMGTRHLVWCHHSGEMARPGVEREASA